VNVAPFLFQVFHHERIILVNKIEESEREVAQLREKVADMERIRQENEELRASLAALERTHGTKTSELQKQHKEKVSG